MVAASYGLIKFNGIQGGNTMILGEDLRMENPVS